MEQRYDSVLRKEKSKGGRILTSKAPKHSELMIAPKESKETEVVVAHKKIDLEVAQEILENVNENNDIDNAYC